MNTITAAQPLLDQNENCSIWYAAYEGTEEAVLYANPLFCKTFGHSLEEIVANQRYHLINPPETPAATIKQYIAEDQQAIERGYFLQRSAIEVGKDETGKDILVLKIRFDQGIIGMFKIIDSNDPLAANSPRDLDTDFRRVIESLRPDLIG